MQNAEGGRCATMAMPVGENWCVTENIDGHFSDELVQAAAIDPE